VSAPPEPIVAAQLAPAERVADPALLIVDMQNDFVRAGAPLEVPDARATIPVQRRLIDAFRSRGRPVVYTRFLSYEADCLMWLWSPECHPDTRACWPGHMRTYDDVEGPLDCAAVVDELAPDPDDSVVDKFGYGSFHGTELDELLRARGIRSLVVAGTVTQICVEETVREGFHRELEMVLVSDGVSSFDPELHAATLRNVAMKFGRVELAALVLEAVAPARAPHYTF
jgi:nicotinamidase-related amidase